jgi:hypothetical protein
MMRSFLCIPGRLASSLLRRGRRSVGPAPTSGDFENETLAQKCKKLKIGRAFEGVTKKLDLASEASAGLAISKGK